MSYVADIRYGVLVPVDPAAWSVALAKLNGKRVTIELAPWRKSRSDAQHRYYWGVVVALLSEHCGYNKHEMGDALAAKFLGAPDERTGLLRIRGTSELSTVEFEDYMAAVRTWAGSALGVFVPQPNEYKIGEES
jgi:hypothetical protein